MKRLFASCLLILFLLNALGFYGLFLGLQFKSSVDANRKLDEDRYSSADEVTFKVPLTVPYLAGTGDFERVSGEFEFQGDVYRLVKQKYVLDTLMIVGVKDRAAGEINQAMADYVKTFAGKPFSSKNESAKTLSTFCKDYLTTRVAIESQTTGWKNRLLFASPVDRSYCFTPSKSKRPPREITFA